MTVLKLSALVRGVGEVPIDVMADNLEDVRTFLDKHGYINCTMVKTVKSWVLYKSDVAAIGYRLDEAQPHVVQARTPFIIPANGSGRAQ